MGALQSPGPSFAHFPAPPYPSLPLPAPPHPSLHLLAPLCASLQTTCSQIQLGAVVTI